MVSPTIFVPPVLSALLGAVAIKTVESISDHRSSVAAIHNQIVSNYWRLEGELRDLERGDWTEEYSREVRLDAIETVRASSPGVYIDLMNEVNQFPSALTSLEYIRREQVESRRAGATVIDSEETVVERLQEIQEVLTEVERNLVDYTTDSAIRSILFYGVIGRNQFKSEESPDEGEQNH